MVSKQKPRLPMATAIKARRCRSTATSHPHKPCSHDVAVNARVGERAIMKHASRQQTGDLGQVRTFSTDGAGSDSPASRLRSKRKSAWTARPVRSYATLKTPAIVYPF